MDPTACDVIVARRDEGRALLAPLDRLDLPPDGHRVVGATVAACLMDVDQPAAAFETAFTAHDRGSRVAEVTDDGVVREVPLAHWAGEADAADLRLFVDSCSGPTIDIGCGPGRLTAALVAHGVLTLGIDVSATAVLNTRRRGAPARHMDVFDNVPAVGRWMHVLLADGNIGIGGDPVRLLRRVRDLVADDGTVLVEVRPEGAGLRRGKVRLCVDGALTTAFHWAQVGAEVIGCLAGRADLEVDHVAAYGGRHVAVLRPGIW